MSTIRTHDFRNDRNLDDRTLVRAMHFVEQAMGTLRGFDGKLSRAEIRILSLLTVAKDELNAVRCPVDTSLAA